VAQIVCAQCKTVSPENIARNPREYEEDLPDGWIHVTYAQMCRRPGRWRGNLARFERWFCCDECWRDWVRVETGLQQEV